MKTAISVANNSKLLGHFRLEKAFKDIE